ncbi:MAG: methylenetetrahydrofolate reductase [Pseudomonadota bacterium]|nr:MAG: hypothetical protein DIU56_15395 [Pseudomonadota bacterium]
MTEANTAAVPVDGAELKRRIVEVMRGASTEVTTHDDGILPEIVRELPPDCTVYVAHTPKATLDDVIRVAARIQSMGVRACPHIVARRIESEQALRNALRAARDAGIETILALAGDRDPPAGPFRSSLEVLATGATVDAGIKSIGVAGHPEGHKQVETPVLWEALREKQAFAERTGTQVRIVTQFAFEPEVFLNWEAELRSNGINLPVYFGLAGPTPLTKLIKYAMACGVGASLNALMKNTSLLGHVTGTAATPDEMLTGIVRGMIQRDTKLLVKPHFFALGGAVATARWMRAVAAGEFDLKPNSDKFVMRA